MSDRPADTPDRRGDLVEHLAGWTLVRDEYWHVGENPSILVFPAEGSWIVARINSPFITGTLRLAGIPVNEPLGLSLEETARAIAPLFGSRPTVRPCYAPHWRIEEIPPLALYRPTREWFVGMTQSTPEEVRAPSDDLRVEPEARAVYERLGARGRGFPSRTSALRRIERERVREPRPPSASPRSSG